MEATAKFDKSSTDKVQILFDEKAKTLSVIFHQLTEDLWPIHEEKMLEIEDYVKREDAMTIVFTCHKPNSYSMKFVMLVLKMVERYQWLGKKDIKVHWDFNVTKSYRNWMIKKLNECFDLDISFSGFLTSLV